MSEVYEVKVPKEIVSWWREITAMEENHKEALNLGLKLIWLVVNIVFIVLSVLFFGFSLANIFFGLVAGVFCNSILGTVVGRSFEYYLWYHFHAPKRHMLSTFLCLDPNNPDKGYLDLSQVIYDGISASPWERGKHRFRVTNNLDDLFLTNQHTEEFQS